MKESENTHKNINKLDFFNPLTLLFAAYVGCGVMISKNCIPLFQEQTVISRGLSDISEYDNI